MRVLSLCLVLCLVVLVAEGDPGIKKRTPCGYSKGWCSKSNQKCVKCVSISFKKRYCCVTPPPPKPPCYRKPPGARCAKGRYCQFIKKGGKKLFCRPGTTIKRCQAGCIKRGCRSCRRPKFFGKLYWGKQYGPFCCVRGPYRPPVPPCKGKKPGQICGKGRFCQFRKGFGKKLFCRAGWPYKACVRGCVRKGCRSCRHGFFGKGRRFCCVKYRPPPPPTCKGKRPGQSCAKGRWCQFTKKGGKRLSCIPGTSIKRCFGRCNRKACRSCLRPKFFGKLYWGKQYGPFCCVRPYRPPPPPCFRKPAGAKCAKGRYCQFTKKGGKKLSCIPGTTIKRCFARCNRKACRSCRRPKFWGKGYWGKQYGPFCCVRPYRPPPPPCFGKPPGARCGKGRWCQFTKKGGKKLSCRPGTNYKSCVAGCAFKRGCRSCRSPKLWGKAYWGKKYGPFCCVRRFYVKRG